MNNHTQIDWSQVIPGKTWLESPNGCLGRVDAISGEDVWVYHPVENNPQGYRSTRTKRSFEHWQIRGEWEDVSDECDIQMFWVSKPSWVSLIHHKGVRIPFDDTRYQFVEEDMKVYKRRIL